MKAVCTFAGLFLFMFTIAAGLTIVASSSAQAGLGNCKTYCAYELVCSDDTGPRCPDPQFPYYLYEMNPYCVGYPELFCPENIDPWVGCCFKCS